MLYCNLKGGLGNMLFQIAAAKSIAIDKGIECAFPNLYKQLDLINSDMRHNPAINHAQEYRTILRNLKCEGSINTIGYPVLNYPFEYVDYNLPDGDFYIDGFFQSEKYFIKNKKEILETLSITEEIEKHIKSKYGELLESNITSVHIRRGDYLSFPRLHPVQSVEYYETAFRLLDTETEKFIIFSDDIEWCKANLKPKNAVYIENERDYIELYLMSMCNNNITCNSSFSWWGAWMNKNTDKVVIGPNIWFGPDMNPYFNSIDIIPENWIKI